MRCRPARHPRENSGPKRGSYFYRCALRRSCGGSRCLSTFFAQVFAAVLPTTVFATYLVPPPVSRSIINLTTNPLAVVLESWGGGAWSEHKPDCTHCRTRPPRAARRTRAPRTGLAAGLTFLSFPQTYVSTRGVTRIESRSKTNACGFSDRRLCLVSRNLSSTMSSCSGPDGRALKYRRDHSDDVGLC